MGRPSLYRETKFSSADGKSLIVLVQLTTKNSFFLNLNQFAPSLLKVTIQYIHVHTYIHTYINTYIQKQNKNAQRVEND